MPARKTELAHRALATHGTSLDLRQRRALILCDGQRTAAELTRMLGADTPALLLQLQTLGYLDALDAVASTSAPLPAHEAGTPASTPAATRRRSLSAARIYVQGMLELQRAPAALALRTRLIGSADEAATVTAILDAIAGLPAFTKPGYAARMRERVAEVLPEPHLPALAALVLEGEADAVA
ncbi:hypothetical protein LU699_11695 [Luteimonas fraxinea]|uniref:hypothetical protein n=1 Tax=Luteimonas fraxinea TaxID=2901869 RepID=UPI001E50120D|nr:hypothetical protein [Luteimonas fraxinea]UHH08959.1 hypothetical protein LU699_11695 [Luteimonas fraxinea]